MLHEFDATEKFVSGQTSWSTENLSNLGGRKCQSWGSSVKLIPFTNFVSFPGGAKQLRMPGKSRERWTAQTIRVVKELTDADYLYLQENLTVTDGIFLDEHVIFSNVTPEWSEFCRNVLGWEVPSAEVWGLRRKPQTKRRLRERRLKNRFDNSRGPRRG